MKGVMKKKDKDALGNLGVAVVYLFGSRALGVDSPLSDVDIGVVFEFEPPGDNRLLYQETYDILSGIYPRRRLDVVFLQKAPIALQFSAIDTGKVLFEVDPKLTADYENRVVNEYLDFRPVLAIFDEAMGDRYAPA